MILTRSQRAAVKKLWMRNGQDLSYREFRKLVEPGIASQGFVMIPWCGIWIGIEADGYTHS